MIVLHGTTHDGMYESIQSVIRVNTNGDGVRIDSIRAIIVGFWFDHSIRGILGV
jgi:hypothetical protein